MTVASEVVVEVPYCTAKERSRNKVHDGTKANDLDLLTTTGEKKGEMEGWIPGGETK